MVAGAFRLGLTPKQEPCDRTGSALSLALGRATDRSEIYITNHTNHLIFILMHSKTMYHSKDQDMLAELLTLRASLLSYRAFSVLVGQVLKYLGYEDIWSSNRHHLKGRTTSGGVDLIAFLPSPAGNVRVLVQLKRYDRIVSRRFVDEARGAMLRLGIPLGVLVTTSQFAETAHDAAHSFSGRPIRLIDGTELGRLMIQAKIGVIETRDLHTGERGIAFDEDSFESLEAACRELNRQEAQTRKEDYD